MNIKHNFMGYEIRKKMDFPKNMQEKEGYVVVKNLTNVIPGACWFETVDQAQKAIAAYIIALKLSPVQRCGYIDCDPDVFWSLYELSK
jgi:hypothetical protein